MKVIQSNTSGSVQLTRNFYLSEFTRSEMATRLGIPNAPDPISIANLFQVATMLEKVRTLLGDKIITVTSGFRCVTLNKAVGSGSTSDHLTGSAADFICNSFGNPLQVCAAIVKSDIPFGQLIYEGTWVHMSLPNRGAKNGEVLTAKFTPGQKAVYLQGLVA